MYTVLGSWLVDAADVIQNTNEMVFHVYLDELKIYGFLNLMLYKE